MILNKKHILKITALIMILSLFLTGCEKAEEQAFSAPEKLSEYLYYMEYNDYVLEVAGDIQPLDVNGGCSTVRNGNFIGRNLDLNYCECPEFIVRMSATEDRFASIGVCANPYIASMDDLTDEDLLRMPTLTNDGINENGVFASVHVVLPNGVDDMSGTNEGGEILDARYVVRYVLDHAESANHAIKLLKQANIVGGFAYYGLHWMIADANDTYIVEIIDGKLSVSKNEYNYMTNFYLNYGPQEEKQTIAGKSFENLPLLNDYAIGVERWMYLRDNYEESNTFEGMKKLMEDVKATVIYSQNEDELWLTEFTDDTVSINSTREDYLKAAAIQQEMYENHDRSNPQEDWISWHTSVYDIENAKFTVWSQEDYTTPYEFTLK